jgi:hypothetical protein
MSVHHPVTGIASESERRRQLALDRLHVVDSLPEAIYEDLLRLATTVCETPIAVVSLIDRDRQWFKARIGIDDHQTARSAAVCDHAIRNPGELMEVGDLAQDERFADFPIVTGDTPARFYAGMPLVTQEGQAIGTVCVVDHAPRALNAMQRASLEALARVTMALLEAHGQRHQQEVLAALQETETATPAEEVDVETSAIAILELQGFASAVDRLGERAVEKMLASLDPVFDACLRHDLGDRINRVASSPEFVAMLVGGDVEGRLAALRNAAAVQSAHLGLTVLMGAALSDSAGGSLQAMYLGADEDLSLQKDGGGWQSSAA